MYDEYAKQLIDSIPDMPDLDRNICRQALSAAYFYIIRTRLGVALDDASQSDVVNIQSILRRLVDSLESIAVFDRVNGQERDFVIENSCAFVAAEALSLMLMMAGGNDNESEIIDPLLDTNIYLTLESALLYMIGGYDINAATVVKNIVVPNSVEEGIFDEAVLNNSRYVLSRILLLCKAQVNQSRGDYALVSIDHSALTDYENLVEEIRSQFYERIGLALDLYLDWLGGYNDNGLDNSIEYFQSLRDAILNSNYPGYTTFADIFHLINLLLTVVNRTSDRSVVHKVPSPDNGDPNFLQDFNSYLERRARGDDNLSGRPFLWPSVREYVNTCLPGPSKDAVIAMPTGSGKSFLAELAISHAIGSGWVLYLAPTNALAHQVRRDLANSLSSFTEVVVRAFVGSEEYTTLTEEQLEFAESRFVAVMTPEKCALAFRLYPERFSNCSLCIFDECHLINDSKRGVTADILLAQLFLQSPTMRMILMSAMVSNPDQLADWLRDARNSDSVPLTIKWRPSRTLRGMLVLDDEKMRIAYADARSELANLPARRVNYVYDSPLALIAGLSGPWALSGPEDYRIARLPIGFPTNISRRADGFSFPSWKNTASFLLSEQLAHSQIPVICFLLSSRHHAFSSAEKITEYFAGSIGPIDPFPPLVEAWLAIADAELGIETALRSCLRKGVAVHTSALLPVEQAASEWMFVNQYANLMFATATLAQGLNLPAIAVVIAGTSMGDSRQSETASDLKRANALILNGFGRAGRPGFSNQGIAILVTDNPFSEVLGEAANPSSVLQRYPILGESDAAVEIQSPVETFLDHILSTEEILDNTTSAELNLVTHLAEFSNVNQSAGDILYRTFAAYRKRQEYTPELVGYVNDRLSGLKQSFLQQTDVPDWMNKVAMKAGVDFFHAWRMWLAYKQRGIIPLNIVENLSVVEWLDVLIEVMLLLPPRQISSYLPDDQRKTPTVLTRIRDCLSTSSDLDTFPWSAPSDWPALWQELKNLVLLYMQGATYREIAQAYLGISSEDVHNRRSSGSHPIPAVLKFIREIVDSLAIDAGCLLALQEYALQNEDGTKAATPEALQALPLCIRNGCDSLGVLAWYRFGFRERLCAHALQLAFPVSPDMTNDSEKAQWVIANRREWLAGNINSQGQAILEHALTIIKEGAGV